MEEADHHGCNPHETLEQRIAQLRERCHGPSRESISERRSRLTSGRRQAFFAWLFLTVLLTNAGAFGFWLNIIPWILFGFFSFCA